MRTTIRPSTIAQTNHTRRAITATTLLLLTAAAQPAAASSITVESYLYHVAFPSTTQDIKDTGENGSTEASTSASFDPDNQTLGTVVRLNSFAAGELGAAHMEADAFFSRGNAINSSSTGDQYNSSSHVVITLDDIILSSPTSSSPVSTSLNFLIDGSLQAGSTLFGGDDVGGSTSFSANIFANNTLIGTGGYNASSENGTPHSNGNGFLTTFTGHNIVTTPNVLLPLNTPITLKIDVSLAANAAMDTKSYGDAQTVANFGDTFSFSTTTPVFNLPAGYTANSLSGGISNNQFTPAPEPTTLLIASAALTLTTLRKRRCTH